MPADIAIRDLRRDEMPQAATLLARGMRDNPIHRRIFGDDPERRRRGLLALYGRVLPQIRSKGRVVGVHLDGGLAGVLGMTEPGRCQPRPREMLALVPSLVLRCGPATLLRLRRWATEWGRHDLEEPHWHLGPAAVDATLQRRGVGTAFLEAICPRMDHDGTAAYLETERPQNVRLYQRFGFVTVGEASVLGVRCWFMLRRPDGGPDRP
jgi:GNAT superfamily N-acetyltransferase